MSGGEYRRTNLDEQMKLFQQREIREALDHAASGGQALHCHRIIMDRAKAPGCFKRAVARGEDIAHLFDLDKVRLVATARRLGVKVILVEREDSSCQHIDLCGAPLKKAKGLCE